MTTIRIMHTPEGAWLNANDIRLRFQSDERVEHALHLMKVGHDMKDEPKKIVRIAASSFIVDALMESNETQSPAGN